MLPLALRVPALLSLAIVVLAASPALAAVHAITVTGQVLLFDEPYPYSLNDPAPVTGGETFTLTFDFDDASPQTSTNGTDVSEYEGAISNLQFTTSNGLTLSTTSEGVLAAINGTANHQWSIVIDASAPGFATNLPDILSAFNDLTSEDEDFGFLAFDFTLLDGAANAYAQVPPELVLPELAVFESEIMAITWESFESGGRVEAVLEVSSITSTPAAPVPALGGLGLGLLGAALAGVGAAAGARARRR